MMRGLPYFFMHLFSAASGKQIHKRPCMLLSRYIDSNCTIASWCFFRPWIAHVYILDHLQRHADNVLCPLLHRGLKSYDEFLLQVDILSLQSTVWHSVCMPRRSSFTNNLSRALRWTDDVLENIAPPENVIDLQPRLLGAQVQANPAHLAVAAALLA
jgi:hypothetical protein